MYSASLFLVVEDSFEMIRGYKSAFISGSVGGIIDIQITDEGYLVA